MNEKKTEVAKAVEARISARQLTALDSFKPTVCQRVKVAIWGGTLARDENERKVYQALKDKIVGIEFDILERYCEYNNIKWGTISNPKSWHFEHRHSDEGHYVIEGFVAASAGHEIEFLQKCAALLSAEYAENIN